MKCEKLQIYSLKITSYKQHGLQYWLLFHASNAIVSDLFIRFYRIVVFIIWSTYIWYNIIAFTVGVFFLCYRYEIITLCWNVDSQKRPRFSKLVNNFSDILEQDAGYLELSQSLSSKEKHFPPHTPLAESGLPTMMTVQEQETVESAV